MSGLWMLSCWKACILDENGLAAIWTGTGGGGTLGCVSKLCEAPALRQRRVYVEPPKCPKHVPKMWFWETIENQKSKPQRAETYWIGSILILKKVSARTRNSKLDNLWHTNPWQTKKLFWHNQRIWFARLASLNREAWPRATWKTRPLKSISNTSGQIKIWSQWHMLFISNS